MDEEEPMEVIDVDDECSNDESETEELQFRWIEALETKNAEDLSALLSDRIGGLKKQKDVADPVLSQYFRVFSKHGIQMENNKLFENTPSYVAARETENIGNIALLLKELSEITKNCNLAYFYSGIIRRLGLTDGGSSRTNNMVARLNLWYLFRHNYTQGIEKCLGSFLYLRQIRTIHYYKNIQGMVKTGTYKNMDKLVQVPESTLMSIYTVLSNWNMPLSCVGEQLIQIAHTHSAQLIYTKTENDYLAYVSEALIAAIALNMSNAQEEIETYDSFSLKQTASIRFTMPFQLLKMISKYERTRNSSTSFNHNVFLTDALRIADEGLQIGVQGTSLIEESCKIQSGCGGRDEEIIELITKVCENHPALGPRLMELAKNCGVGYEVENLMTEFCNSGQIHPSEPIWLKFVVKSLNILGKYESIEENLRRCSKIMFEFLDFDVNRFSEEAWALFHDVVQKATHEMIQIEWQTRYDWWPKFHNQQCRKRRKMKKYARKLKKEVLEALSSLPIL